MNLVLHKIKIGERLKALLHVQLFSQLVLQRLYFKNWSCMIRDVTLCNVSYNLTCNHILMLSKNWDLLEIFIARSSVANSIIGGGGGGTYSYTCALYN